MRTQRTEEEVKMGWERTNSAGINQRALCRVRLKLDDRASAARTIARMHAYVQAEANGLFWRWFMPILHWKSRRSFSSFVRLSAEISSAHINVYVRVRSCEATDFWDYNGSRSSVVHLSRAAVQLLIARLSVSSLKQLNFTRDRANCARRKSILCRAGHNIIRYSNFDGLSSKPLFAIELIVFEIKPAS